MANEQNLIPAGQEGGHMLTREEQSAGGKKSAEKRRLQGAIKKALESNASATEFDDLFEKFGIEKNSRDYAAAIACAITMKAAQGDLSAASFVRDTIGEKPKEEVSLDGGVVIVDDIKAK